MNDQPVPNPLAQNPKFSTHKVFAAIGLILIAAVIIIGGIWYYVESKDTALVVDDPNPAKVTTTSAKPSTNTSKVETKDWKEHTFEKLKISIKLPTSWEVLEKQENRYNGVDNNSANGLIVNNGSKKVIEIYFSTKAIGYLDGSTCSKETVTLNSEEKEFTNGFAAFKMGEGYYEFKIPFSKIAPSDTPPAECNQNVSSLEIKEYQELIPIIKQSLESISFH